MPNMKQGIDKIVKESKQEPIDRYGNPIDKDNLDMYDDEDIYETDEQGFVTLPKKLKKGLENKFYKEQANKTRNKKFQTGTCMTPMKKLWQLMRNKCWRTWTTLHGEMIGLLEM